MTFQFQSTHPSGVRLDAAREPFAFRHISIHAPQWGATHERGAAHPQLSISIHAPQWGATSLVRRASSIISISIHAPQWGATWNHVQGHLDVNISIHAPQWGATARSPWLRTCHADFNPRTPVGCDELVPVRVAAHARISIHAPQWGATSAVAAGSV